jgi:hypothetical protein
MFFLQERPTEGALSCDSSLQRSLLTFSQCVRDANEAKCARCREHGYPCLRENEESEPDNKRRKLSRLKCDYCRLSKQKESSPLSIHSLSTVCVSTLQSLILSSVYPLIENGPAPSAIAAFSKRFHAPNPRRVQRPKLRRR